MSVERQQNGSRAGGHVCPWWLAFLLHNPVRRLFHRPEKILEPYVRQGMTVMDVGCGVGYFSIPAARIVGDEGRVVCVDVQHIMLDMLWNRAEKAGVAHRIRLHWCEPDRLGVDAEVDFALAFAVVHEVPDARGLLDEVRGSLKSGAKLLLAEPRLHVSSRAFEKTLSLARGVGLELSERPRIRMTRAALLVNSFPGRASI